MIKIAKRTYDKEELEIAKRCHDTFEAKEELYKLMKRVVFATNYGGEEDDYTKTIHLNIGHGTLSYDPYYQRLTYYDDQDCEYDVEEDDLETVQKLVKEIKERFNQFENGIKSERTKLVKGLFDKPIGGIFNNG